VPDNVLRVGPQIYSIIAGTIVFLAAAFAFAFKYHATSSKAGERGQRPDDQADEGERVRPDGFIVSFAGVISEAGGGVPFTAWVIMGATLVCYFVYLFFNWKQG
jgi:hypothetical protein